VTDNGYRVAPGEWELVGDSARAIRRKINWNIYKYSIDKLSGREDS